MFLFGGNRPWDASHFTASDDRVRGGKSQSYLTVLPGNPGPTTASSSAPGRDHQGRAAFSGVLDIKTLGGAGFASQRTVDDLPAWDVSGYDTLVLDVAESDGKKYTITLKDQVLPKRPDGREQSTTSWEYDFVVGLGPGEVLAIPFRDFEPTYRGKPKPDAEPLDLSNVRRFSFMMRSFFGEQEGDFSIVFNSVSVEKRGETRSKWTNPQGAPEGGNDGGYGLTSWISRIFGWSK